MKASEKPQFIAYLRTSTKEQVAGLEAQRTSIRSYVKSQGGVLLHEYEEHMTGTSKKKRMEVYKAVAHALEKNATLVVHKIDRIARDLDFWQEIKRSKVKFLSLDNPGGGELIANILMAVAESEQKWMKVRQKESYAELKAQGETFGSRERMMNPEIKKKANQRSAEVRKEMAKHKNKQVIGHICDQRNSFVPKKDDDTGKDILDDAGKVVLHKPTWEEIADRLNELGYRTVRGNKFWANSVKQLYDMHCPVKK